MKTGATCNFGCSPGNYHDACPVHGSGVNIVDNLTDDQIQNELLRPAYMFKGAELWPWSRSAKHLWNMVCSSDADTTIFQVLAMMWILRKREIIEPIYERNGAPKNSFSRPAKDAAEDLRANVIPKVYSDLNEVRAEIIFWRDELTQADEAQAMTIFEKILTAEKATETQVSNPDGQKKMRATAPATSDSSSSSSENTTAGAKTKRSLKRASPSKT